MSFDLGCLHDGWIELESDPGLFTLLLEDFGVKGLQVEEIYDVNCPVDEMYAEKTYGFILLFRWTEGRRARRMNTERDNILTDAAIVNQMFFAQQMIPNSCATHALISILLNCTDIELGETLTNLKGYTKFMSPENKGLAIGNTVKLAWAHNSHASRYTGLQRRLQERVTSTARLSASSTTVSSAVGATTAETFHFVSYMPIAGRLYELDGLKAGPIDHGPWSANESWIDLFVRVISARLCVSTSSDCRQEIRFSLMSVVGDRRASLSSRLVALKRDMWQWHEWTRDGATGVCWDQVLRMSPVTVQLARQVCAMREREEPAEEGEQEVAPSVTVEQIAEILCLLRVSVKQLEERLADELEKRKKYRIESGRRSHDYTQFITTYLTMLASEGLLGELLQHQIYPSKYRQNSLKINKSKSAKKRKK